MRPVSLGLKLERSHLLKALKQVEDTFVLSGFAVVAQQLAADHLGSEMGELDAERQQQFHAATSGEGGHGNRSPVEERAEVIALHLQPGNGVGEG